MPYQGIYQYSSGSGLGATVSLKVGQKTYIPAATPPITLYLTVGDNPNIGFSTFDLNVAFTTADSTYTVAGAGVSFGWSGNFFPNGALPTMLPPISTASDPFMTTLVTTSAGSSQANYTPDSVTSCSALPPTGQTLQALETYKGPDPQNCSSTVQVSNSFSPADTTVNVFFVVNGMNLTGGDTVTLHWINPANFSAWTTSFGSTATGSSTRCFYVDFNIAQYIAPNWGQWQVQVYVNSNSVGFPYSFEVANGQTAAYLLTTAALPAGAGFITAAPSSGNGDYSPGTQVTLTATANAGYSFSSWTVDGLASAANPLQLTMNQPHTVSADFSSTPPVVGAQCYTFSSGSAASLTVNITHLPPPTPTSVSWIYQYTSSSGVVGTASLTIGETTYTPASSPPTFIVTVGDDPSSNFSSFEISVGFESTNNIVAGATASLYWSGNFFPNGSLPASLPPISGASDPIMSVDVIGPTGTVVDQTYTLSSITNCSTGPPSAYLLTTATLPAGTGFITAAPSSGNGDYSPGTPVTLTATANAGFSFSSWTVDGSASAANPLQLTMNQPQTVSANFSSTPPVAGTALRFVPVTPCRVVDTRNPVGPLGGPSLPAGSRDFPVPSSSCGIPATALAYSMNVTVVPHGTLGYLSIWPAGQPQPVVSTLNSFDGRIKADAAIVPAGVGGAISLYVTDPTDVVLDINGYFVPAGTAGSLSFYPVSPCRVIDTRNPAGPLGGPLLVAGQPRTMPVRSSACNIPSTASAYSTELHGGPQGRTRRIPQHLAQRLSDAPGLDAQ